MSYAKAMKQKVIKRNKHAEHLYVGFGTSKPKKKTEQELREFYPKFIAYHTKHNNKQYLSLTEDQFVSDRL